MVVKELGMSLFEKVTLIVIAAVTIIGVYLGWQEPEFLDQEYLKEDGWIENLTAIVLFASGILLLIRLWLGRASGWVFVTVTGLACLAFLFVAGEEISWGQRIFDRESSEFFQDNNAQGETNLHNLEFNGVKINKLIFGQLLTVLIVFYIIIWPLLRHFSPKVKQLTDQLFVPIPRLHQSIAYLLVMGAIMLMDSSKKWELLEFDSVVIFFLILFNPVNKEIFNQETRVMSQN